MDDQRAVIPGSEPKHPEGMRWSPLSEPDKLLEATIVLRRRIGTDSSADLLSGHFEPLSRDEAEQRLAADPDDIAQLLSFARQYGLKVLNENAPARTIKLQGTARQMSAAFGVNIANVIASDGREYLSYRGAISVPKQIAEIVMTVLGLDQRPIARHA